MDEISIIFSIESPQQKEKEINIKLDNNLGKSLLYKFFIGCNGVWETLREFGSSDEVRWVPKKDGKYTIMVQAKEENSKKCFDYVARKDFIIGKSEERLINKIEVNKKIAMVGEKVLVTVNSNKVPLMYRYWIKEDSCWNIIKDYSSDNILSWSLKKPGEIEILVECKNVYSKNSYDDFKKVKLNVLPLNKVEIRDFKCLSKELLSGEEIIFQIDASSSDNRTVLYRFVKIKGDGTCSCIQDYSTKRIVNYIEKESGDYKLLCEVKDMYSQNKYDDRAIINFFVKKYKEVKIESFTTDKISPQICESKILLKSVVSGGKSLLYRYIIDGNYGDDSGYIRQDNYYWDTKMPGEYKITLWTKDASSDKNYEDKKEFYFTIDDKSSEPIVIDKVSMDKGNKILKDDTVIIKVKASGTTSIRFSFIIRKNGKEKEVIDYGSCNWIKFTPEEEGKFEIEIRVKDKFSSRPFDSHSTVYIESYEYFPARIDYILYPIKEFFLCGDKILVHAITTNTKNTLLKYVIKINGYKAEESNFVKSNKFVFTPKCKGIYNLEIYAKNINSSKEFDNKREIKFKVNDALPVTNTKIKCDKKHMPYNESITFSVENSGGKDNLYEFYIMENDNWIKVQNYSKKNYYSFIPFLKGKYKVLALCKNEYRNCAYEDYDIYEFNVD
ncbi:triple tyrosine motif-containing protein [Clostridium rectalis]|uniref:triple tyrosine motif-containing protein n=1 Tax=Clostridium rectalis TaxID=2040295 RepID=UPI000F63BFE6|nr:triple tyrosine motif-containing protein [Clostridium rectalis]